MPPFPLPYCIALYSNIEGNHVTEQVNVAVTFQICIRELFGLNLGRTLVILTVVFRGFLHSLQENVNIEPQLGHDSLLPHSS
jgi:hypothetical protein